MVSDAARIRRVLVVAALSALAVPASVCLLGGVAHAEPTSADREQARSLMQEGRDLRDKGHPQDALKRFKAADDIMHVPTTGLEVARTQAAMGMFIEARDTIAAIRKLPTSPSDPAPFQDARNKAEELDSQLDAKIPSITISVQGGAEGETPSITVDGVPVPAAAVGLPRRVNVGKHTILARTPSGHGEQTVEVREGDRKDVQVALTGGSTPESLPVGSDQEPNQAPKEAPSEPSGPKSHSPTILTWIGVGVGGASAIAGAVTGAMSMSLTSKIKNQHECPSSVCINNTPGGNDYSSANSLATISDVTWALAGVGAAVAVASIVIGHDAEAESKPKSSPAPAEGGEPSGEAPPASQSRLRVVPWVGLGSAGVVGVF